MSKPQPSAQITPTKGQPGRKAGAIYFPRNSLTKALEVPRAIWNDNGGEPYSTLSLAKSLNSTPTSSTFQILLASSLRYGLSEGSYVSDKISLTPLGRAIVAPTADVDVNAKLREALQKPDIFQKVFSRFDKKPIPREEIFKNTLQTDFVVPKGDAQACYDVIMTNVSELKLADDIKGTKWLRLDLLSSMLSPPIEPSPEGLEEHEETTPGEPETEHIPERQIPKKIFVAHGKNKKPLEQLKSILTQFKVPFEVAIDLPHKGRPIATKVLETMLECTSGIFIFTADEQTTDIEGKTVMRPSDNVVFELGAGIALFGDKIVIFREDGVDFGSDFTDYGHITFDKDKLDAKALDLMKELIGLGFLQVIPT